MDEKESVTNLAGCLSISMQNLSLHVTGGPGAGKIRLRNVSEVLMPGFNFNNNSNKTSAGDDEELFESEDGVMKKGQDDGSKLLDDQHEQTRDTDCKVCKQSPCLSGQFLTE